MTPTPQLRIESSECQYVVETEIRWRVAKSDLAICGEYTTSDGPWRDDYFLAFVSRDGEWSAVPWELADGEFREAFAQLFGFKLEPRLANKTDFVNRIIWPESLQGEPMLALTRPTDSTPIRRLAKAILGTREIVLSPQILRYLGLPRGGSYDGVSV